MLFAWSSGGVVEQVILHPLAISRTDVSPNPSPLWVVWGGPVTSVLIPLLIWRVSHWRDWSLTPVVRFFAGFCLIANGLYLATAVIDPVGDSAVLLRLGCPVWVLVLFGVVAVPIGFLLWHGQARHFGYGPEAEPVNRNLTISLTLFVLLLIVIESLLSARL